MEPAFEFSGPPAPGRPFVRLVIPRVGTIERLISYTPQLVGLWTHWADGRTHPHFSPSERCIWCQQGQSKRWKGYLLGWSLNSRCLALLEIPSCSARRNLTLMDPAVSLAGALVTAVRAGPGPNSELRLTVQLSAQRVEELVTRNKVVEALCRIWQVQPPAADQPPAAPDPEGGGA